MQNARCLLRRLLQIMGPFIALSSQLLCAQTAPPQFQAAVVYRTGVAPNSLAVGDFNSDGVADLVVVNAPGGSATDSIRVLLGNGDGTFSPAGATPGTANLSAVATGDFNGDGNLDIVVTDTILQRAIVLLGNGDGTFSVGGSCATDVRPIGIVVADFNGDANLDIVVANSGDGSTEGTVSVCLGAGDGTLGPKRSYRAAALGFTSDPVGIAFADFDGDYNLDLAVALHSNAYSIIRGNGDGTFQTPITQFLFNTPNPTAIAVGDLNGDGIPDLAITTNPVEVLLGNGDATFQQPVAYPVGLRPDGVAIADLNGDGLLDIVVANNFGENFSVLLNQGAGIFGGPAHYAAEGLAGPIVIADFNGDSNPDVALLFGVVLGGGSSPFLGGVEVATGKGDGSLRAARSYLGNVPGELSGIVNFAVGDIRSTGLSDLAMISGEGTIHILLQNPDFTYQPASRVSPGVNPEDLALADVNNDGNLDLVVIGYDGYAILKGNGDGTFQTPIVQSLPFMGFRALAVADLNGDGNQDLIVANVLSNADVGVFLGRGDGTFQPVVTHNLSGLPRAVVVDDFNQDGIPDLAVATFGGGGTFSPGTASVLMGNGDGTFQTAQSYLAGVGSVHLTSVDINGDGFPDIAVVNGGNGTAANGSLSIFLNNGDGTFQSASSYSSGTTLNYITAADFAGRGAYDVAVTGSDAVYLFENNADGTGTLNGIPGKYAAGTSGGAIAAGPFGGGRFPDLAVTAGGEGITILLNVLNFQVGGLQTHLVEKARVPH
jgi:VCBS repeat protein/FG-GAP repeat protein